VSGIALLVQLVFGFATVLAPGVVVARALGVRRVSAAVAWSLALVFVALALTFAFGMSLSFALALLLGAGAVALPAALRRWTKAPPVPGRWPVLGAGVLLGLLLWRVAGHVGGDGFFHLARVQKLLTFDDLSLDAANEFPDGGLHPGYAFPLWHGFLALVAKVSGADPVDVVVHGPTVLAPIVLVVAFEVGWALFRHPVSAAAATAAGVAVVAMAPGHGGAFTALALPATGSRQLLVPAALALALEATRRSGLTHFWSRSRQSLWRKGETSGHAQHVDGIYADCDRDVPFGHQLDRRPHAASAPFTTLPHQTADETTPKDGLRRKRWQILTRMASETKLQ